MMDCREAQKLVWGGETTSGLETHIEGCAGCRREAELAGRLRASLAALGNRFAMPPRELEDALFALASRSRAQRAMDVVYRQRWRGAAVGAAAAATAAFGVIVARRFARADLPA